MIVKIFYGVLDRIPEQERLRGYIACIILLDKDGYFLWHTRREEENVFDWEEKVFFIDGEREKQLEEVVLKAVEEQKELRNYYGKNYQFELPIGEGFLSSCSSWISSSSSATISVCICVVCLVCMPCSSGSTIGFSI